MPQEETVMPLLKERIEQTEAERKKAEPSDPVFRREERPFEEEEEKPKRRFGRKSRVAVVVLALIAAVIVVRVMTSAEPPAQLAQAHPDVSYEAFLKESENQERHAETSGDFHRWKLKPPPPPPSEPSAFTKFVNKAYEFINK